MLKKYSIAAFGSVVVLLVMAFLLCPGLGNHTKAFAKANSSAKNQSKKLMFSYESINETIKNEINNKSYKVNKFIKLSDLAYVRVTYYGFDNMSHIGELIVNKKVAKDVVDIFRDLYKAKFPIEKMRLIDNYNADDSLSMEDNNTSSFCFRTIADTNTISMHAYGMAIDINPVQNPYMKDKNVYPQSANGYVNRNLRKKGMIIKNGVCYKAFVKRGWKWGGNWKSLKDYQHFEIDRR